MQDKMKALVYYAPGDIRVEQVDVGVCGDDEIRVKIDACAVCGTDLKACVAQQFGASKIILAEINEERLKQAEPFGFDVLVNPAKDDQSEIVME